MRDEVFAQRNGYESQGLAKTGFDCLPHDNTLNWFNDCNFQSTFAAIAKWPNHLLRRLQTFFQLGRPGLGHFCHFTVGDIGWVFLSVSLGGFSGGIPPI